MGIVALIKSDRISRSGVYDGYDLLDVPTRGWFSRHLPMAVAGVLLLLTLGFSSSFISRNAVATINPESFADTAMLAPTTELEGKGSLLSAGTSVTAIDLSSLRRQTVVTEGKSDLNISNSGVASLAAPAVPRAKPANIASLAAMHKSVKIIPASYQTNDDEFDTATPATKRLLSTPAVPFTPLVLVAPVAQPKAQTTMVQIPAALAPKSPPQALALVNIRTAELTCLARAVYFEARSESELGQLAVAKVVLNRVKDPDYPKTICGVVYQGSERRNSCQFSFACDGLANRVRSPESWARAKNIAERAIADDPSVRMLNATNYHADYVTPRWAKTLKRLVRIGHHIFYKNRSEG